MAKRTDATLKTAVEAGKRDFKSQLRRGTKVVVYKNDAGKEAYLATVVRVNKVSITIESEGIRKRIPLDAIADLAPGERARCWREKQ